MKPRWETFEVSESQRFPELEGRRVDRPRARARLQPARRDVRARRRRGPRRRASAPTSPTTTSTRSRTCSRTRASRSGLSDAGAHVDQLCDAPLATDLLGNWVREREVMPLERAVRKLTGEPADMFGFARRGYLREGYWADVCVFDPQTVGTGPDPARPRLPGRRRTPHRRGADRRAPRAGERHADPRRRRAARRVAAAAGHAARDRLSCARGESEELPMSLRDLLGSRHRRCGRDDAFRSCHCRHSSVAASNASRSRCPMPSSEAITSCRRSGRTPLRIAPSERGRRAPCRACTRCTAAATSSAPTQWTIRCSTELCPNLGFVGVSVDYRLAPETPYPGPLEDCHAGLRWIVRACRRAADRPRPDRRRWASARAVASQPRSHCSPRPRRAPGRVPASGFADARRPPGHAVEPAGRASGVEPRVECVRLAVVPRRPLRPRRHAPHRGAGPGRRPVGPAPGVRVRRGGRRVSRRGRRLRPPAQPGGCSDGAPRLSRCVPWLLDAGA